ncbi:50S ribosomal protein L20 [Parcubacteria bacterium SG8_24]|nr:MAG: 50S ribosomal protein L20 [Parcubacteria bacterium SG8_24]
MPRVKRGKTHLKSRKKLLSQTKGYKWGRKSKIKLAKTAVLKAGAYAYRDRKNKKRTMRGLWQTRIGAAARLHGLSYSKLMGALKKANIVLDRKILAELAAKHPETFKAVAEAAQKK